LREAAYFVERLETEQMPLAGMVLNRMHTSDAPGLSVERSVAAAETLEAAGQEDFAAAALRVHADRLTAAMRDARRAAQFHAAHPRVRMTHVAAQASDVHDLEGLRAIGAELAAEAPSAA
jgi:hypothetical protein